MVGWSLYVTEPVLRNNQDDTFKMPSLLHLLSLFRAVTLGPGPFLIRDGPPCPAEWNQTAVEGGWGETDGGSSVHDT